MIIRRLTVLTLAAALPAFSSWSWSQSASGYPSKPVKIVVPTPPGQGADIIARMVADALSRKWGQQIVVENRGGSGGVPATAFAKSAPPDGYTLLVGTSQAMMVNPNLYAKLPYDVARDFVAITGLYVTPLVVVATPTAKMATLADLVEKAKLEPGGVMYGSGGTGSSQHLTGELLRLRAKIAINHVPYKGSPPAMTDLIGGQIPLMVDGMASALPHIKSGRVVALGVTSEQRVPQLPEVPTIAEQGLSGFSGVGWAGIFAPAGTSRDIVEKLGIDIRSILNDPAMRQRMIERGTIPDPLTAQQTVDFVRADTAKWGEVAKGANIRVEE